ncbi:MAG: UDP-N-acetylmuramate dehydrogenase [Synergistaceae bacterium]|jgi:UDP-N-acetylmuramate dehydrogenase|nr:UDP-N-acetylmuramate dehydrogenase [Synergistaceae bacterium]
MPLPSAPERIEKITRHGVLLAGFTTWRVGGRARMLITPHDSDEASLALRWLASQGLRYYVLGGGSNTLVADGEIDVPIISTRSIDSVSFSREGGNILISCGAGVSLKKLFALSVSEGWGGLEFAAGIPGTVGGAVMGNAGTREGEISQAVQSVEATGADGRTRAAGRDEIEWGYRRCGLAERGPLVISSAVLRLRESTREAVRRAAKQTLERRKSQPLGARTAGCVFKNPVGGKAGRLLEEAGCKGLSVGGAVVSELHANFIENRANCTATDIATLAALCQDKVYKKFGVTLSFEIKPVGFERRFMEDDART